ncbi:YncE family protein [Clostridium sp. NSJ-6]|uniref:YncE family protein n=1 Tax=Clostridium hominis TaxID=2763036 RepID=A0ABR7D954_9CLOT|nr:YncE family protein [Clostridium hominis]MBC5627438.1 YncE family protein [Clostridium hominis]MDU2672495.1 YncE family protein [Clostridium sp.]
MNSIIICNTGADSLSRITLDNLALEKITFNLGEKPIGPHGIKTYDDGFITTNSYSDSISFFDKNTFKEKKNAKIGPSPNDLIIYKKKVYTICGESNSVVVYDILEDKTSYEIATGSWPHSIDCDIEKGIAFITNFESNDITVINMENNNVLTKIEASEYPTKVLLSKNKEFIYVCESYLGHDKSGFLDVISTKTLKSIKRIEVGSSPMEVIEEEKNIYVSNFTDGTISVINKSNMMVMESMYVGGMPKGMVVHENKMYVLDYLKGKVYIVEDNKINKVIAIESEPNAMTLF